MLPHAIQRFSVPPCPGAAVSVVGGELYCELHAAAPPMYDVAAPPTHSQRGLAFVRRIVVLLGDAHVVFRLVEKAMAVIKREIQ
jgi:hypothetical protein